MSERKERIKALKREIDQLEAEERAEASGDGLAYLKQIITETGYFEERTENTVTFWKMADGHVTESDIQGYYVIPVEVGYQTCLNVGFGMAPAEYCSCFPSDLKGWKPISKNRFEHAARDYNYIKALVKEAMKP